ncbi:hypothetical protein Forpe1208_v009957 [Fusarium oxysporum f. sp. rapae]|uniref:Uncharacterized protein n=1 Tax=Fusarium oxysporum f. sp. rapae TaxID=485398 RepID=A0A8J5NS86_FUSOX|nr:hypothetical protein Forpe1208_v009957 [Fusarium oxysporum f. sp. rapae]
MDSDHPFHKEDGHDLLEDILRHRLEDILSHGDHPDNTEDRHDQLEDILLPGESCPGEPCHKDDEENDGHHLLEDRLCSGKDDGHDQLEDILCHGLEYILGHGYYPCDIEDGHDQLEDRSDHGCHKDDKENGRLEEVETRRTCSVKNKRDDEEGDAVECGSLDDVVKFLEEFEDWDDVTEYLKEHLKWDYAIQYFKQFVKLYKASKSFDGYNSG